MFEFVQVVAEVQIAMPFRACGPLTNARRMKGRIAVVQRQDCMFQEKARYVQESGAVGIIIIGNTLNSSFILFEKYTILGILCFKNNPLEGVCLS